MEKIYCLYLLVDLFIVFCYFLLLLFFCNISYSCCKFKLDLTFVRSILLSNDVALVGPVSVSKTHYYLLLS